MQHSSHFLSSADQGGFVAFRVGEVTLLMAVLSCGIQGGWVTLLTVVLSQVFLLPFRFSAAGQLNKQDSVGVSTDNQSGAASLQRDKAVCISTSGEGSPTASNMTQRLCRVKSFLPILSS